MTTAERQQLLLIQADLFALIFLNNLAVVGSSPYHIRNLATATGVEEIDIKRCVHWQRVTTVAVLDKLVAAADEGKITLTSGTRAKIDLLRPQVEAYHAQPDSW